MRPRYRPLQSGPGNHGHDAVTRRNGKRPQQPTHRPASRLRRCVQHLRHHRCGRSRPVMARPPPSARNRKRSISSSRSATIGNVQCVCRCWKSSIIPDDRTKLAQHKAELTATEMRSTLAGLTMDAEAMMAANRASAVVEADRKEVTSWPGLERDAATQTAAGRSTATRRSYCGKRQRASWLRPLLPSQRSPPSRPAYLS